MLIINENHRHILFIALFMKVFVVIRPLCVNFYLTHFQPPRRVLFRFAGARPA